jgi:hypothetical protein
LIGTNADLALMPDDFSFSLNSDICRALRQWF